MIDVEAKPTSLLLDNDEPLDEQQFAALIKSVRGGARSRQQFEQEFGSEVKKRASALTRSGVLATKAAQGCYALGQYDQAIKWLDRAGDGKEQCYLKACCLRQTGDQEAALREFEQAEEKGCESFDIAMEMVDCLRRKGDWDEAETKLKRISRMGDIRAEYHYQWGCLHEAQARRPEALAEYERAISLDGNHTRALFALAYLCDLCGDAPQAVEYYERCIAGENVHVSALLNLAVLYEDVSEYEQARLCVQRVLNAYPNHQRARLFLKDIESSMTMYYDEDQERRVDRRNQVLQIPISDFELSVRSRNCLKKMNIKNLGDLLRVTEVELLAYKNFGETSLHEIRAILTPKGLRLGQLLEDRSNLRAQNAKMNELEKAQDELLSQPVTELKLSVRARKALGRLNINIIGDLTRRTEAELLGCKNFGMTSLQEVTQSLKEKGLALRKLED